MSIKKFAFRITLFILVLAMPLILLVTTNLGLNATLRVASRFATVKVRFAKAEGKIIGEPISITGLTIEENGHILQIDKLDVDWQLKTFTAVKIKGFEHFLPNNQILANGQHTEIEQVRGKLSLGIKAQYLNIELLGKWQQALLSARLSTTHQNNSWQLNSANITVGRNTLMVNNSQSDNYNWELSLVQPEIIFKDGYGKLHAIGSISKLTSKPELTATVTAASFGLQDYELKNFSLVATPLSIIAKADKLNVNNEHLSKLRLNMVGNLAKHTVHGSVQYKTYNLQLNAHGDLNNYVWKSNDLTIKSNEEQLKGSAVFDLNHSTGKLDMRGKIFNTATIIKLKSEAKAKINIIATMHMNEQNYLEADLNLKANALSGNIDAQAEDFSMIMKFIPELTRLKGKLSAKAKISGTIDKPIVRTDAHITQITATFPGMGIKIKPMELHIKGDETGKFILTGKGKMRRGTGDFVINGFVEPFKANMPNEVQIVGTNIEFVNNENAHLTAANDIKFYYNNKANRLDITGYIEIQQGTIFFASKKSSTVKSKDVVFIDHRVARQNEMLINPNINLRILEQVRFTGFDLDAYISGKLDIAQRNDALYATGRVTIKQGTYELPGQKLEINKGRLLYPPGTLLVNPSLDIKMHGVKKDDLEITVQGTAQKPTIRESTLSESNDKVISQALTTGSGMLSKTITGGKFKLPELSLTNRDDHMVNFFDERGKHKSSLTNKDLVVGLPIGKKLHVEYLHGLSSLDKYSTSTSKRVRLKYDFHKNWAIGVESGDQGGGADLSFSFEK